MPNTCVPELAVFKRSPLGTPLSQSGSPPFWLKLTRVLSSSKSKNSPPLAKLLATKLVERLLLSANASLAVVIVTSKSISPKKELSKLGSVMLVVSPLFKVPCHWLVNGVPLTS